MIGVGNSHSTVLLAIVQPSPGVPIGTLLKERSQLTVRSSEVPGWTV